MFVHKQLLVLTTSPNGVSLTSPDGLYKHKCRYQREKILIKQLYNSMQVYGIVHMKTQYFDLNKIRYIVLLLNAFWVAFLFGVFLKAHVRYFLLTWYFTIIVQSSIITFFYIHIFLQIKCEPLSCLT